MKVKMKRCVSCKTLLSNSAKACFKCNSKELEKGVYSDESMNKVSALSRGPSSTCPTCCGPVSLKVRSDTCMVECRICGEYIMVNKN
jgi:hypothetical protein